ncbi:MAG: glycosyltransferase family 4 protein [Deltaproteobacteria bacterium]|nr:glycosyltransferase family 4 protein [Deltaproteobacteria bacterium]
MRIALVTRRFDPAGGGTERDLTITARVLTQAGHHVTIHAAEIRAASDEWTLRKIVAPPLGRALGLLWFARTAGAAARREGADLVLSFARIVDADIMRSGGGAHSSYIRAARQWQTQSARTAMALSPYHHVQMMIERRGFSSPRLKAAIAVSNLVRDELIRTFALAPSKAIALYNGVELDRFFPAHDAAERLAIRREMGVTDSLPLVMFVGNGFARKGLRFLIESWTTVGSEARLIVVGTDQAAASYERLVRRLSLSDRIKFLGQRANVDHLMRGADAFALPSLFEPFGNVAMEAMASGVPVLTSARSGVSEVVPASMREFVVNDPTDRVELASQMNALIEASSTLKIEAREAAEQFTWERHARELLAIIGG